MSQYTREEIIEKVKNGESLKGADLTEADLTRVDLVGVDLSEANLSGAELGFTNLGVAILNRANLSGANLFRANLGGANLSEANLNKANFWESNLAAANLEGADLIQANLSGANLSGANLSRAKLGLAKLGLANLWRANLDEADLSGVSFWRADLGFADLRRTKLVGADLGLANLGGADLTRAELVGANLSGASFWKAELGFADLRRANLSDANLSEANLRDCDLRSANLNRAKLTDADLTGANIWGIANTSSLIDRIEVDYVYNCEGFWLSEEAKEKAKIPPNRSFLKGEFQKWLTKIHAIEEPPVDYTPRVFISYAINDKDSGEAIDQWLRDKGFRVIADQRDFISGTSIRADIVNLLRGEGKVVCIYSENSANKAHTKLEKQIAEERELAFHRKGNSRVSLIYFCIDDTPLPPNLTHRLAIKAKGKSFQKACEELRAAIASPKEPPKRIDLTQYDEIPPWEKT
jgi:uncharacterized protein YjbI with pentapeptide repeats